MFTVAKYLPECLRRPLWGKREYSILPPPLDDPDWRAWENRMQYLYVATQQKGIGRWVNEAGYRIVKLLSGHYLTGEMRGGASQAAGLEIGPGVISHLPFWTCRPGRLDLADVRSEFLSASGDILARSSLAGSLIQLDRAAGPALPLPEAAYDFVLTFYSLEHLHFLGTCLEEYKRVLKPGGFLAGAIPAEGGLAWGLGRFLTTRRLVVKRLGLDYDKIIAMEHCNTAAEVIDALDKVFIRRHLSWWPCRLPVLDLNLIIKFIYEKRPEGGSF